MADRARLCRVAGCSAEDRMSKRFTSHRPRWCGIIVAATAAMTLAGCAGSSVSTAGVTGNEQGGKVPYTEGGIQSAMDAAVFASGALKTVAVSLLKITTDVRFLGSGPRASYAELALPEVQPGSSIMPGKVNPVIAESAAMVSAQVVGNDATVALAGASGNFELNVMLPVIAHNLLQSIELLATTADNFTDQLVVGLAATDRGPALVEQGLMLATALAPEIGYDKAADLSKEAYKTGRTIREVAREKTGLSEEELDRLLDARKMTER